VEGSYQILLKLQAWEDGGCDLHTRCSSRERRNKSCPARRVHRPIQSVSEECIQEAVIGPTAPGQKVLLRPCQNLGRLLDRAALCQESGESVETARVGGTVEKRRVQIPHLNAAKLRTVLNSLRHLRPGEALGQCCRPGC